MNYANFDYSTPKQIVITFEAFEPTPAQFEDYLSQMVATYNNHSGFYLIFDATKSMYLPASLRIRQGVWVKENSEMIKKQCKSMIFILPGQLTRILYKAIILVSPMPVPSYTTSTREEAIAKANELAAKA
ncbi:MAG TPA: hypothetical protein DCQ31_16510 [Bacteroidales bacterium]|nr:hypothetical protein [Bacteroidales bacterium]